VYPYREQGSMPYSTLTSFATHFEVLKQIICHALTAHNTITLNCVMALVRGHEDPCHSIFLCADMTNKVAKVNEEM
jgi:hypothetical protein